MEEINKIKVRLQKLIKSKVKYPYARPLKVIEENGKYYLIFRNFKQNESDLVAGSSDGFDFENLETIPKLANFESRHPASAIVAEYKAHGKKVIYYGDRQIFLAYADGRQQWETNTQPLILSANPTEVGGAFLFSKGPLILYFEKYIEEGITYYRAFFAQFDKKNPENLLWKMNRPIWDSRDSWPHKQAVPLGSVKRDKEIVAYWYVGEEVIYAVLLRDFFYEPQAIDIRPTYLKKHQQNPILAPREENAWEAFTTLNPAAVYLDGKVHLLYRAQGYDYISTIGYAVSSDGLFIDERMNQPVYEPSVWFETNTSGRANPKLVSAGGYGGCEDPRATVLDKRLYMVYVAFDGWSNLRLALTSIDIYDFLNQRWNWEKPVLISPPGVIDKSGCLLPEKINGKYVFFHRVFPNILIDYVDDLNFDGKNNFLPGKYQIKVRPGKWDSRKIGAGAPPLKTKDGWLLIYYGVDDKDASKYHIGAMLLDLNDPTRVLHRSNRPILSPEEEYEVTGFKPGIAYPCGAVIIKDDLLVYYGAADSVVCVAKANLAAFLAEFKSDQTPHMKNVQIKEVAYR